jgi:hypothetical protein
MKCKWYVAALLTVVFVAGWVGGRSSLAAEAGKNYDADAGEMDRTQEVIVGHVRGMNEQLKTMARAATLDNLQDPDKKREKEVQALLGPVLQDSQVLFVQAILLSIDNAVDRGGAAAEGALLGHFSKRLDVPIRDLVSRQAKTGLGLGGVVMGYAIAKAGNVPADELFTNKMDNKSWPEVMRARQVSVTQLQGIFAE